MTKNFRTASVATLNIVLDRIELWLSEHRYTSVARSSVLPEAIVFVLTDDRAIRFGADGSVLMVEDDEPYVIDAIHAIPNLLRTR